ncbi:MAG TPA: hypothetical protein VF530_03260 [Planctomycetota bacterium]
MRVASATILAVLTLTAPLAAQRGELERKAFEDRAAGYRLRTPKEWNVVPVAPDARGLGLAFQAEPERNKGPLHGRFRIVLVDGVEALRAWADRTVLEVLGKASSLEDLGAELDEPVQAKGLTAQHTRWLFEGLLVDTWLIEHGTGKVGVIGTVDAGEKYAKSWLALFERAATSFEAFEAAAAPEGAGSTYAEKLAAARSEAERTPGWRALPTPSEKFILLTSCENQKFVDEVIDRLERSREIFEQDYPPPGDFTHVSIVRLCAKAEEFHRYGGTGGGVAGWFSPSTTELVLYDAKEVDRNMSYAVMTHEAFHQYCHFLFGRSEAHRWFDEGHGDYYGGMKFDGPKARITARMPGGLERLSVIREMITLETYKPLVEHLNYDHPQWQGQGPSNVSPYAQSWSIVYMLRQGMLGNVHSKVWKDEYAEILPAYIATLRQGFEQAYREERARRTKDRAKADGKAAEASSAAVIELDSSDLGKEVVRRIWKEAMTAAWGDIDLAQFEEDWKLYVKKYLKD